MVRVNQFFIIIVISLFMIMGCNGGSSSTPKPSPTPSPTPSPNNPSPDPNKDIISNKLVLKDLGIKTEAPSVVVMPIHVSDMDTGESVAGLTVNNLKLYEDAALIGEESFITIKPVLDSVVNFNVVLMVDVSSSLTINDIAQVKNALTTYVESLTVNQNLAVYTFDDTINKLVGFTNDKTALKLAINSISRGNASTNLYGAIESAASLTNDVFSLNNLSFTSDVGAMVVVTDGSDTSGISTLVAAKLAVQDKRAYAIPVGNAGTVGGELYNSLKDIFSGDDNVLAINDFSALTTTLSGIKTKLEKYYEGLYYVYYASPSRSGSHSLSLSINNNLNTESSGKVEGAFDATGFSSVVTQVQAEGATDLYLGEKVTWNISTAWSNDPDNYSWTSDALANNKIKATINNTGAQGVIEVIDRTLVGQTIPITITDNNWNKIITKNLFVRDSRAPKNINLSQTGFRENTIAWNPVIDATGYKIYWSNSSGVNDKSNVIDATNSQLIHSSLTSGKQYYYRIQSVFTNNISELSGEYSLNVIVDTPQNFTISTTPTENTLGWDLVGDATYKLVWNTTGNPSIADNVIDLPIGTTSYTHSNLDASKFYYYSIIANDVSILSTQSLVLRGGYTLGVNVSGLTGEIVLTSPTMANLIVSADGFHNFSTPIAEANPYNVTVLQTSFAQNCTVTNEQGVIAGNVDTVNVSCVDMQIPEPTLTFGVKKIILSWNQIQGASHYNVLFDADGQSGYQPITNNLTSLTYAYNIPVHLTNWPSARFIIQSCDGTRCVDSLASTLSASQSINSIGYFKASNTDASDHFGHAVNLSADGNTLAVSAPYEGSNATGINGNQLDNSAFGSGAVYLYRYDTATSSWLQQAYIKASNAEANDNFGFSISLSADGNTLAVGANSESSNATGINGNQLDNNAASAGAVYLYRYDTTTSSWTQQAYIKASNTAANDRFGSGVSLSADGETLAVGAFEEASSDTGINGNQLDNSAVGAGAVYLYRYNTTTSVWTQQAYIKASNAEANDGFGYALSLSADSNALAVGAFREDGGANGINGIQNNNGAINAGAVYLYRYNSTTSSWSQQAYIKASNTGANDAFGVRLSLSADGNSLAVGATAEASSATGINGYQNDDSAINAGAVYLYRYNTMTSAWSQQAYIKSSNSEGGDGFGIAICFSADANTLAVGAGLEDSNALGINGDQINNSAKLSGAVYLYRYDSMTSAWSEQVYIKASNKSGFFGRAISLNADGKTLAVGANSEKSKATGINGNQLDTSASYAGAVYLY